MAKHKCKVCGAEFEITAGEEPICPVCNATGDKLELVFTDSSAVSLYDSVMKYPRLCPKTLCLHLVRR